MIIKHFELNTINLKDKRYYLLYGSNTGLIEETIGKLKLKLTKNLYNYEENEILRDEARFKEDILNKSFFDDEKLIIISRITDKFHKTFQEVLEKKPQDITLILTAHILEKKSKIRNLFEKDKDTLCVPFYEDNYQTLNSIAQNFFKQKNIRISNENINIIIERAQGNRINLNNELSKIESYSIKNKKIEMEDIIKLTNLAEDFSVSDLVDNSLAKNEKKTLNILNENNFASDDTILILRIFLIKLKRLLNLQKEINNNKSIENVISSYKPPIFWKEKDIVKKQIRLLSEANIRKLIIEVNDTEFLVKKNPSLSINIVTDFILKQTNN